jgi:pimeloyl-ACP methyl ester carboxylesterase
MRFTFSPLVRFRRSVHLALALMVALLVSAPGAVFLTPHPAKASTAGTYLLLVHGFTDSCAAAFNTLGSSTDPTSSAYGYFTAHGWAPNQIDEVGYYNTVNDDTSHGCTSNVNSEQSYCSDPSLVGGHQTGWTDDPINHLACMFAWYVNNTYPTSGPPVIVVAHSMGGLIVRAALGESGRQPGDPAYNPFFPQTPLNVAGVITVGTPHGGLDGAYLGIGQNVYCNPSCPEEFQEMVAGSTFMQWLTSSVQDPQGANGTYWALMAASITPTPALSGEIYPAGDGVVKADNALTMSANFKILYGQVWCEACEGPNGPGLENTADASTAYVHEIGLCDSYPILKNIFGSGYSLFICNPPFYLNDDSAGQTSAWICSGGCTTGTIDPATGGGIKDLHVFDTSNPGSTRTLPAQPTLHSLAMINALTQSINVAQQQSGLGAPISWGTLVNGGLVSYFTGQVCNGGYAVGNQIAGSAIYWSSSTGAHEVHGCIFYKYWHDRGGPAGTQGFPTSDVLPYPGGYVSYFAGNGCGSGTTGPYNSNSAIYSSSHGTYFIGGCIYVKYNGLGLTYSTLGFPTSDVTAISGGYVAYFAGTSCGSGTSGPDNSNSAIYYGNSTGGHEVQGCIYNKYVQLNGPGGLLGWPTSDEYSVGSGGDRRSNFQNGIITWIKATGQVLVLYYNGDQTNNCVDQPNDTNCDGLPADACDDAYLIYVNGKPALADVWGTDPVTGARVHFGWVELFWSPSCASNFAVTFADTNNGSNAFVYAKVTRDNQNGTTKYYEVSQNNQMTIYTRIIYSPVHPDQACGYITLVLKNGHKASDGSNPSASACTGWY